MGSIFAATKAGFAFDAGSASGAFSGAAPSVGRPVPYSESVAENTSLVLSFSDIYPYVVVTKIGPKGIEIMSPFHWQFLRFVNYEENGIFFNQEHNQEMYFTNTSRFFW